MIYRLNIIVFFEQIQGTLKVLQSSLIIKSNIILRDHGLFCLSHRDLFGFESFSYGLQIIW